MFYILLVCRQDPGFLAQNTEDYHAQIKQIAQYDEWRHHRSEFDSGPVLHL